MLEIEALYRSRFAAFHRAATAIVGDSENGCDAVQDAFASAVQRRQSYRGDAPLEAWIWRIVVNVARDRRRRAAKETESVDARQAPVWNGRDALSDDATLRAALARLPEQQRLAIFLRYYADLDYAAIAEALGLRPGTVAATLSAAHGSLRRRLEEISQ